MYTRFSSPLRDAGLDGGSIGRDWDHSAPGMSESALRRSFLGGFASAPPEAALNPA